MFKKTKIILMSVFLITTMSTTVLADTSSKVNYIGGSKWEMINSFDQTTDGGYVTVGLATSNDGDLQGLNKGYDDALIAKYNANGIPEWIKTFGGSLMDEFFSVKQTKDGGYIAVGSSSSITGDMESSHKKIREGYQSIPNVDAIIVKYDSKGNIQWKNDIGGTQMDRYNSVVETDDGNYFVVGESYSYDGDVSGIAKGHGDAICAMYYRSGELMWKKIIGGDSADGFNSVIKSPDGSFIAVGYSGSQDRDLEGTSKSLMKGLIVKIKPDQSISWVKTADLFPPNSGWITYTSHNGFQDIKNTADNGFIVAGNGLYGINNEDGSRNVNDEARIFKYDSNGNVEWQDTYRNGDYTTFNGVAQGQDGSYTAVGYTSKVPQKLLAVSYDKNGKRQWDKYDETEKYGGEFRFLQAKGDNYVAAGFKYTVDKSYQGILYIGKFEELNGKFTSK